MDYATRYTVLFGLTNRTANQVADKIFQRVITVFGCIKILRSDHAPEFCGEVVRHLNKLMGTTHIASGGYTPWAQSVSERRNTPIVDSLRCLVRDKPTQWANFLQLVGFSWNNTPLPDCGGVSPAMLNFARQPRFPSASDIPPIEDCCQNMSEFIQRQHQMVRFAQEKFNEFLKIRQQYDRDRSTSNKTDVVAPGRIVFVQIQQKASGGENRRKLARAYVPKLCIKRFPDNTCLLQDIYDARTSESRVHVKRLKCFKNMDFSLYLALQTPEQVGDLAKTPDATRGTEQAGTEKGGPSDLNAGTATPGGGV